MLNNINSFQVWQHDDILQFTENWIGREFGTPGFKLPDLLLSNYLSKPVV